MFLFNAPAFTAFITFVPFLLRSTFPAGRKNLNTPMNLNNQISNARFRYVKMSITIEVCQEVDWTVGMHGGENVGRW